jgi:hypothetical protein
MATIDRIEPAYTPWTPRAATRTVPSATKDYIGRHRAPEKPRALSFTRLFYWARHRRR